MNRCQTKTLTRTSVIISMDFTVSFHWSRGVDLTSKEDREFPDRKQRDGGGVPWTNLKKYGYVIQNFPAHLDYTRPESWSKSEKLKVWDKRNTFKFVKASNNESLASSAGQVQDLETGRTLPVITVSAPVIASQPLRVQDAIKLIYDVNPDTFLRFWNRLQNEHVELANQVTPSTLKGWVTTWRRGVRSQMTTPAVNN
jgi:hypothetical protein